MACGRTGNKQLDQSSPICDPYGLSSWSEINITPAWSCQYMNPVQSYVLYVPVLRTYGERTWPLLCLSAPNGSVPSPAKMMTTPTITHVLLGVSLVHGPHDVVQNGWRNIDKSCGPLSTSTENASMPLNMMTSSNGNIFRVTPFVRGIHQSIPLTKASDAELWCFLWSEPE